ncbi:hypothetical protein [Actinoplanes sp. NPDC049118]|uniref:hypothetical protein n=1 Tax=Actinoplanes sp. NPDC049118 TaxID=3155769 RepID=UPI003408B513
MSLVPSVNDPSTPAPGIDPADVHDPHNAQQLLDCLTELRRQRDAIDHQMRQLIAYAREHVKPRPYRLADLAEASGMSISGVRIAYSPDDTASVAPLLHVGGYLACGCLGSQREHTCTDND